MAKSASNDPLKYLGNIFISRYQAEKSLSTIMVVGLILDKYGP